MSVQPAFQGIYIHPINNLQTSLRLKTVKYKGSAASFLHTSWLPPAVAVQTPKPYLKPTALAPPSRALSRHHYSYSEPLCLPRA